MDKQAATTTGNVYVYMDIAIGDEKVGRIIIELFKSIVPKTVQNFLALSSKEGVISKKTKNILRYKNTCFHRVIPQFLVQGGDVGESIYGEAFDDENFKLVHDVAGAVGMANSGPNTNNSQFYITTVPCPHLDGTNVVFGYVKKGLNAIRELSEVARQDDKPLEKCTIIDCGEIAHGVSLTVSEQDETPDTYPPYPDDYEAPDDCKMEDVIATIKESGNYFFKAANYVDSDRKYRKVLRYIEWIKQNRTLHNCSAVKSVQIQTMLNLAAVRLKKHSYKDADDICTQVLLVEPTNAKAFYRRGQARLKLLDYDKALVDLQLAMKLFPNDNKIVQEYNTAKKNKQGYLQKERVIFTKMFQ